MTVARLLPRFREAYRALDGFAAREAWSRADIARYQLARLNQTWRHAVDHVPYYRDLAARRRLPPQFSGLDEFVGCVPLLPKSLVRDRPREFLSGVADRGRWNVTSGSTGVRTRTFWSHEAHRESLRGRYRFLDAWGIDVFDRCVMLWGDRTRFLPLSRRIQARVGRLVQDRLRRRLRLAVDRLDRPTLQNHLRRMVRFQPAVLYAYSTAAYVLAREALDSGLRCESLRLVILTAEVASPHMIETVGRAFGVPAVMEYGSVECGFLAGEHPDRLLRTRDDWALIETLPRPDGHYDVVVTVLGNPSFPLFRYLIGDTTDAPLHVPAHGLSVLRGMIGRQHDCLVTQGGSLVHSAPILFVLNDPAVRRFLARQRLDGSVHVLVEAGPAPAALDVTRITRRLQGIVGFPVTLEQVTELPPTDSSKNRPVVSDLAASRAS